MKSNGSLLTLDRLRLAVSRNQTARKRAALTEDNVDMAYNAAIRRDVLSTR